MLNWRIHGNLFKSIFSDAHALESFDVGLCFALVRLLTIYQTLSWEAKGWSLLWLWLSNLNFCANFLEFSQPCHSGRVWLTLGGENCTHALRQLGSFSLEFRQVFSESLHHLFLHAQPFCTMELFEGCTEACGTVYLYASSSVMGSSWVSTDFCVRSSSDPAQQAVAAVGGAIFCLWIILLLFSDFYAMGFIWLSCDCNTVWRLFLLFFV